MVHTVFAGNIPRNSLQDLVFSQLLLHCSRHIYDLFGWATALELVLCVSGCAALAPGDACEQRGHALCGERGGGQVR